MTKVVAKSNFYDFTCKSERLDDGQYRVTVTGNESGMTRTEVSWHPVWALLRTLAPDRKNDTHILSSLIQSLSPDVARKMMEEKEATA